ncbi:hypothetical protein D6T63_18310 [Arthrobacter cheniae]|uniref:Uncharacterized protein n=1 Tax=Arthrobacter cheniae TaxID=1258888 RepID=A0A3A5LXM0_9MICC|nr:hypothetical protein [Arthrobacter cheniae]RJT74873.1 hypothetical protein D6T63_18310 [Arthrobacter cheniae]
MKTKSAPLATCITVAAALSVAAPASAAPADLQGPPAHAAAPSAIANYPSTIASGSWDAGHIQGIAVDEKNGYVYHSFTDMLVKTDLAGNVIGTVEGFTGHLGDLDFNTKDGRVYGSLEYKTEEAFYIAIFDVDKITEVGMNAEDSGIVSAVYLEEVVEDFTADMNNDGVFDGNIGNTADHRYGSSGIDGVSFGPEFGKKNGKQQLMVAYGVYRNNTRTDNDNQVLLQYDISGWKKYERPLTQADPHTSGPADEDAKYFIHTGNTHYGVQNLAYDEDGNLWYIGVYRGSKPEYPNRTLYVVDGTVAPQEQLIEGQLADETGLVVPLLQAGLPHEPGGIYGWEFKSDVGIEPIGDGYFYVARDFDDYSSGHKQESATLELYKWTGEGQSGFESVAR